MALPASSGTKEKPTVSFYTIQCQDLIYKNQSDVRNLVIRLIKFLSDYYTFDPKFDGKFNKKPFYFQYKNVVFKLKINKKKKGVLYFTNEASLYVCENETVFDGIRWIESPTELSEPITEWFLKTIDSFNQRKIEQQKEKKYEFLFTCFNRVA